MLTREYLNKHGIKYTRPKDPRSFRWLPGTYELETAEFTGDSGEFMKLNYFYYLLKWAYELNFGRYWEEYFVVRTVRNDTWYYTILFIEGGLGEDHIDKTQRKRETVSKT